MYRLYGVSSHSLVYVYDLIRHYQREQKVKGKLLKLKMAVVGNGKATIEELADRNVLLFTSYASFVTLSKHLTDHCSIVIVRDSPLFLNEIKNLKSLDVAKEKDFSFSFRFKKR